MADSMPSAPVLRGAPNFRDVGNQRTADGRLLRAGRVYRSEVLHRLHDDDMAAVSACGIGLVMDLRSAAESAALPNRHFEHGTEVLSFDIGADIRAGGSFLKWLKDDPSPSGVSTVMRHVYGALPLASVPALRTMFERLAAGAPPLLVHCAAGKDRTGFVVAMLLHAVGVQRDAIVADYLESDRRATDARRAHVTRMLEQASGQAADPGSVALIAGVRQEYLEHSFSVLQRDYGGIDGFLTSRVGLEAGQRRRIREHLLAPD